MTPLNYIIIAATCVVLLISVVTDIRYNRIFNAVTVPFAALGLVLNIADKGWAGILFSLEGIGLGLATFFVSALIGRILGAGDCKLFAAIGALQGPHVLLWAILYSLIAGGVLAIIVALWRGVLRQSINAVWRSVYFRLFLKMPMDVTGASEKTRLPYALAICAGTLVVLWRSPLGL